VFFLLGVHFVVRGTDVSNQKVEKDHGDENCDEEPDEPSDEEHKWIVCVILEIEIASVECLLKMVQEIDDSERATDVF